MKDRVWLLFFVVVGVRVIHPSPCPLPSEGRGFQKKKGLGGFCIDYCGLGVGIGLVVGMIP